MKRYQKCVLIASAGVILASNVALANNLNLNSIEQTDSPKQEYHSITDTDKALTPQTPAASGQSKAAPSEATGFNIGFQTQLSSLRESNLLFQQKSLQSLRELAQKNVAVTTQLATINQILASLTSELDDLKAAQAQIQAHRKSAQDHESLNAKQGWRQLLETIGISGYFNLGGAALLVFCLGFLAGRTRYSQKQSNVQPADSASPESTEDDTKDEYDFMSSNEAIPAMLDLARSYIAMEDYDQARAVLKAILVRGDDTQKDEANTLMDKISQ